MNILYTCPAFDILDPAGRTSMRFKHGDKIALPFESRRYGTMWHFFTLGTVEGYAIENGECPHEALARHEKFAAEMRDGRKPYWANANAVVISAMRQERKRVFGFTWGDEIILQGKRYSLDKAANQNVKLTPIEGE